MPLSITSALRLGRYSDAIVCTSCSAITAISVALYGPRWDFSSLTNMSRHRLGVAGARRPQPDPVEQHGDDLLGGHRVLRCEHRVAEGHRDAAQHARRDERLVVDPVTIRFEDGGEP